jgi:beta-fructofuranosidase
MGPYTNPAIAKAMQSVATAAASVGADPTRPVYHFRPPALWMNDPNGPLYHQGYYHLFYQHNPYGDEWGHIHWGHARSKDLIYWEHLPIALWPSEELDEGHCFSGYGRINGQGQPMLFYTKVSPGLPEAWLDNEQWAAIGDADLLTWEKHPANPILSLKTHGGPTFEGDWRDPFIFEEAGRVFMTLGAKISESDPVVALYEAEDARLARWSYRGILYQLPQSELRFFECPNFFKLGEKWILLTSPYRPVEYVVGSFDVASLRFKAEQRGILDYGYGNDTPNFYATNILFDDRGRCILLGWVRGFEAGRGWNGCLALPRLLSIGPDGHPRQQPIPELSKLRGRHSSFAELVLNNSGHTLANVAGDTLEIRAAIEPGQARAAGLKVRRSDDGRQAVTIRYNGRILHVAGTELPFTLAETEKSLDLHVFLDRSVLEVFVNDGRVCVTRVIYPPEQDVGVEVFAEEGSAVVRSLDVWEMGSIW